MVQLKRKHTSSFKSQVAFEALKEQQTIGELSSQYQIHPTQIRKWRDILKEKLPTIFGESDNALKQLAVKEQLIDRLYRQVGQLTYELDWLKKRWGLPLIERLLLVEPTNSEISVRKQCELLQINRSTYYHQPYKQPELAPEDIWLMEQIDKVHTDFPYYGSRKVAKHLTRQLTQAINRKRVGRLMEVMGIEAIYPKPNLSKPTPGHQIYPYLLKGVTATYPNHIWGTDITYIPVKGSWLYLVAIMDWYSRYILSWELSDSLSAGFCVRNLQQALSINIPDIHNSDQGSQLTANEYLALLQVRPEVKISMDGRGRCMDNIFTERLWRSVKHEEVYLHDYQSPAEARASLTKYLYQYNHQRLHEALGYLTPQEIYSGGRIINN